MNAQYVNANFQLFWLLTVTTKSFKFKFFICNKICIHSQQFCFIIKFKWHFSQFTFDWFFNGLNLPLWLLLWLVWSRFGLMRASFDTSSHFLLLSYLLTYLLLLSHNALEYEISWGGKFTIKELNDSRVVEKCKS